MQKKRILFVYVNYSTFVKTDFEILSSLADVTKYQFTPGKGIVNTGYKLLKQFFYLAGNIWRFDAIFIWFSDFHSLLPILFTKISRKRSYLVIGGYEVARIKSLNYGALCSKIRGYFCITSIRLASLCLTVSNYVDRKVKYIAPGSKRQLVYNCVELKPMPDVIPSKENLVLTVGIIENRRSFYLKGIDTFIEVARNTPDYQFLIIGLDKNKLQLLLSDTPENLSILGRVPHSDLSSYYLRSKYYCQLSLSESFGVSVAEAMNHGCIPIVSNEGGLPEVVGDTGYIVKRDPVLISRLIKDDSQIDAGFRPDISARMSSFFSRDQRAEMIKKVVLKSLGSQKMFETSYL
jgi:glycosyltransferase involved in cell wall biosynthesis